jgi:hypothetical protein
LLTEIVEWICRMTTVTIACGPEAARSENKQPQPFILNFYKAENARIYRGKSTFIISISIKLLLNEK